MTAVHEASSNRDDGGRPIRTVHVAIEPRGDGTLHVNIHDTRTYQAFHVLGRSDLRKVCNDYWEEVEDRLKQGALADENKTQSFLGWLITEGTRLARHEILDDATSNALWVAARGADVLVLGTSLDMIPWEALFQGGANEGTFLADEAMISRIPPTVGDGQTTPDFEADRALCLDGAVGGKEVLTDDTAGRNVNDHLHDAFTASVISPGSNLELVRIASVRRLLYLVCGVGPDGYRIGNDQFSRASAEALRFSKNNFIFIAPSEGTISSAEPPASDIRGNSQCAVMTLGCVFPLSEICNVVRHIEDMGHSPATCLDFWRSFEPTNGDPLNRSRLRRLFLQIYGTADTRLFEGA